MSMSRVVWTICVISLTHGLTITFYRHAQSTFNAYGDTQPDVPLSETGFKQAQQLGGDYDLVVCSTLRRARQTLDHSRMRYGRVLFTELCREICDGNPSNHYALENTTHETSADLLTRIQSFCNVLRAQSQHNDRIAVISHHDFLQQLTRYSFQNAHWWSIDNLDRVCGPPNTYPVAMCELFPTK